MVYAIIVLLMFWMVGSELFKFHRQKLVFLWLSMRNFMLSKKNME